MPEHIIRVRLNCDDPAFTEDEANEFVDEHLAVATDRRTAIRVNMSTLGHILAEQPDGEVITVPVEWEVEY